MKSQRQTKILELITTHEIETQEELLRLLNLDGFQVTQATVSRDIRELKLVKTEGKGSRMVYSPPYRKTSRKDGKYSAVMEEGFVSAEAAQNILVIKTVSGMAMAVAAAIDAMEDERILGTIAGDDTIMSVTVSNEAAKDLKREFMSQYVRVR